MSFNLVENYTKSFKPSEPMDVLSNPYKDKIYYAMSEDIPNEIKADSNCGANNTNW